MTLSPEKKHEIEMICADLMDLVGQAAARQLFKIVKEIVALNKETVKEAYASGRRAGCSETLFSLLDSPGMPEAINKKISATICRLSSEGE